MEMKSNRVKGRYDKKARLLFFEQGEKVWFYKPRKKRENS